MRPENFEKLLMTAPMLFIDYELQCCITMSPISYPKLRELKNHSSLVIKLKISGTL